MSYLKATDENSNTYRFSLMPANDKTSSLFPAVKTVKVSASNTLSFGNISYVSGKKYYVNVKFRTRGDGNSTSSKCSSVGFIANRSDWQNSYSYIHNSATAYAERGRIVKWTFEFTATANESRATALYFIINNSWSQGYDNQTIDLFYCKMYDSDGVIYYEDGCSGQNLVNKWENGTSCSSEYSKKGSLKSEPIVDFLFYREYYFVEFYAKSSENYDNGEVGFGNGSVVGSGRFTIKTTTEYKRFSGIMLWSNTKSQIPNAGICFYNWGTITIYVKNLKLKKGDNFQFFLKLNNGLYYLKLHKNKGKLKIKQNSNTYYLKCGLGNYKYSEITDTYTNLENGYEY